MAVRRARVRGGGRAGWRALTILALLSVGAYLAFDVLDLDGSDLRSSLAAGAVAEAAGTGVEVNPRHAGSMPEASHVGLRRVSRAAGSAVLPDTLLPGPSAWATRQAPFLARASLGRDPAAPASPDGDPPSKNLPSS